MTIPTTEHERLLTVDELADYLQVPIQTIYAWNKKNVGPVRIQVGRSVRYRWADVLEWLASREVQ